MAPAVACVIHIAPPPALNGLDGWPGAGITRCLRARSWMCCRDSTTGGVVSWLVCPMPWA